MMMMVNRLCEILVCQVTDTELNSAVVNDNNATKKMSSEVDRERIDRLELENKVRFVVLVNIAVGLFKRIEYCNGWKL